MLDPSDFRKEDIINHWHIAALEITPRDLKNKKILELGSGMGSFAQLLRKKGFKNIICSDGSNNYIRLLRRKHFSVKRCDFNEKLPFKNESFDLIFSLEVIEHIEKAEFFLKEIKRILKKNGCFILSTPNFAWLPYRLRYLFGLPPYLEGYHIRHFTYSTLLAKLEKLGFKIIESNSLSPIPVFNRLIIKLKFKPFWIKISILQNFFAQNLIFKTIKY